MKPPSLRTLSAPALALAMLFATLLAGCKKESSETTNDGTKSAVKGHTHDSPDEKCFICEPSLRDADRLWCREHDRYEDRCWLCHPELEDPARLFCKEHALYEDECFLCHPELKSKIPSRDDAPSDPVGSGPPAAGLFCNEHGVPEAECGICHPELLTQERAGRGLKVRLRSATSAAHAGVVVGSAGVDQIPRGVESLAELTFDQNQLAQITPLVSGVIKNVEVDLGVRVREGELLASVTSIAISEAQATYRKALAERRLHGRTLERERTLRTQGISSEKDLQEAEAAHDVAVAAVEQAAQHLSVLGFDEKQIQAVADQTATPGVLELRAPFAGEIIERTAVRGARVDLGEPLFTLADTSVLWAIVQIPESDLSRVRVGQSAKITIESLPEQTFTGTLTWVSAEVDHRTRLARGRVELANPDGRLKANMFARALIITEDADQSLVVPESAIQNVSGVSVLFVKAGEDLFEVRPVRVGNKRNGYTAILAGLESDDPVVLAGAFALKSQFLISRLGAGCVDE